MTTKEGSVIVFQDGAGEYYLVPQAGLEHWRVPDERKGEVQRLLAEQQDVQGYFGFVAHAIISLGTAIAIGAGALYRQYEQGQVEAEVPTIQFPPSQEPVRGPGGRPA